MTLKLNIIANYLSQIYIAVISLITLPLYIKYMGIEAYGLIGFYTMLQICFQLLDVGITPTIARETARLKGGATDALSLRRLLRAFEVIFITISLIACFFIIISAEIISNKWLTIQELSLTEVKKSIELMAFVITFRGISGIYRGAIIGFENIFWLSIFNSIAATIRFILVIPALIYINSSPAFFFKYQLFVSFLELLFLLVKTYHILPRDIANKFTKFETSALRKVFNFSSTIAITSAIAVFVSQIDKIILSNILSLTDYGYFTLAALAASGVLIASAPINSVIMPRLAHLHAQNDEERLVSLYRNSVQMVAIIAIPTCLVLAFFPELVLWSWTGNSNAANKSASVLRTYALGNGILTLAAFPFYIQYAKGDLKLHLIGSFVFLIIFLPILTIGAIKHGAIGSGAAWLTTNLIYFIIWPPLIHKRIKKGLHKDWLVKDLLPIVATGIIFSALMKMTPIAPSDRIESIVFLFFCSLIIFLACIISSSFCREYLVKNLRSRHE